MSWRYRLIVHSFLLSTALLLLLGACHPKISPRLEGQLKEPPTTTTKAPLDSTTNVQVNAPPLPEEKIAVAPYVMLRLEKTACYGQCPIFELKLFTDGMVHWHGIHYVDRLGWHETFLEETYRYFLLAQAQKIEFFSMSDVYPTNGHYLSDLPNTLLYLNDGQTEKSITMNHLIPLSLKNYVEELLEIVENLEWRAMVEEE